MGFKVNRPEKNAKSGQEFAGKKERVIPGKGKFRPPEGKETKKGNGVKIKKGKRGVP